LVEHLTRNEDVCGSIPHGGSSKKPGTNDPGFGYHYEAVREWLFPPISTSPISGICQQAQIIILEILKCIPVVIIFAFLDLGKIISFSDTLIEGI
jgi:hypothetical protein